MKAHVNQDDCIGCGLCAEICPEVFRMNEDNLAEAYQEVTPMNEAAAREAMDSCPVTAISIE